MSTQIFRVTVRMHLLKENTILSHLLMIPLDKTGCTPCRIDTFMEWRRRRRMELQIGKKIKILRSDNVGEYKSDLFL